MRKLMAMSSVLLAGLAAPVSAFDNIAVANSTDVNHATSRRADADAAKRDRLAKDQAAADHAKAARADRFKQDQQAGAHEQAMRADKLKKDQDVARQESAARADKIKKAQQDRADRAKKHPGPVKPNQNGDAPK